MMVERRGENKNKITTTAIIILYKQSTTCVSFWGLVGVVPRLRAKGRGIEPHLRICCFSFWAMHGSNLPAWVFVIGILHRVQTAWGNTPGLAAVMSRRCVFADVSSL